MKKTNTTIYTCSKCDAQFPKWTGRCLECGSWSTLKETKVINSKVSGEKQEIGNLELGIRKSKIQILDSNKTSNTNTKRISTNISEIDRVLGGGIVPGSLILLGGQPGIGKSTLVLQLCNSIPNTLYVSGEESAEQVGMRLSRLKLQKNKIAFLADTNIENIISHAISEKPAIVIIDSIQTMYSDDVESEPGNISQVRTCTGKLLETAKTQKIPIIIIGHVTKEGAVAGPKTLEHIVDTVLYLEGDAQQYFRLLRGVKNRFGSTNEIGVFEMTSSGLETVENPSAHFIEHADQTIPGSIVTVISEGKRCFLVEVQSLVNKTIFGIPQRKASGYDTNRLQMLLAVLSKRLNFPLSQYDVFLNIIGGLKVKEVSIDLAVCMSLISAYKNKVLDKNIVAIGEVGLGGEIRPVPFLEKRIKEAESLGFKKIYVPKLSKKITSNKIELVEIKNLSELIKK